MEVLAACYWFEVDPGETAEPTGEPLPDGSAPGGTADPNADEDFLAVSEMLTEEENEQEEQEGGESENGSIEQNETISDVIPYLENISVQLGVIDVALVLLLCLVVIRQFIRVPR